MWPSALRRILNTANFRLALIYALVFSVSAVVLGGILYFDMQRSLERQMRDRIMSEMEQLLGDYHDDGIDELRHDIRERIQANPVNRLSYHVRNAQGRMIFDRLPHMPDHDGWYYVDDRARLVLVRRLDAHYTLALSGELTGIAQIQNIMLHGLAITFALALILGVSGGVLVSRRFLRRIDHINRMADAIGKGDLSQRLTTSGTQDDFDQLAVTINAMLDRIEQLLTEVRLVTTNIAHDLRTPLATLRNRLEVMAASHDDADEMNAATELLDQALATFSALLRIAEIESGVRRQAFETIDISTLLTHLGDTYAVVAEEEGKSVSSSIEPHLQIIGDRQLVTQLVANLVENSLKHGGPRVAVHLRAYRDESGVHCVIGDNGAGIPAEEQAHILKPFYRMDRSRTTRGNGLGLSLVAAIIALHEAELHFDRHDDGFDVHILFPVTQKGIADNSTLFFIPVHR